MKLKYQAICLTLCLVSLVACKNSSEIQDKIENGEQVYSLDISNLNGSGQEFYTANLYSTLSGTCEVVDNGAQDVTLYYTKTNPAYNGEAQCVVEVSDEDDNVMSTNYYIIDFSDDEPALRPNNM